MTKILTAIRPSQFVRQAVVVVALVVAGASLAACGSDSSDGTSSSPASSCKGDPLKFTTITPATGMLRAGGQSIPGAVKAAVDGVNKTCAAGRPIAVTVCDDKSDANASQACGRKAAEDGSLAIVASAGGFDNGAQASRLPLLFTGGGGQYEATNETSYPAFSGTVLLAGYVNAAKAAGADNILLVGAEVPPVKFAFEQAKGLSSEVGIDVKTLYFPPTTTDFTSVAAQVALDVPDAIGVAAPVLDPLFKALKGEDITGNSRPLFTLGFQLTPPVLAQGGDLYESVYTIAPAAAYTDVDNPGIKQMRAEYKAAGINADDSAVDFSAVLAWSQIHSLADSLGKVKPADLDSLDSTSIVAAAVAGSPYERPEHAPFGFGKPAFTSDESKDLSQQRVFSRTASLYRIKGGTYTPVSKGFFDVTEPFELGK